MKCFEKEHFIAQIHLKIAYLLLFRSSQDFLEFAVIFHLSLISFSSMFKHLIYMNFVNLKYGRRGLWKIVMRNV